MLTLAYRAPLDWELVTTLLGRDAISGVATVEGGRYGRTVQLDGRAGVVFATNVSAKAHLALAVSISLLPVLMPLLVRLRRLFDLDAEPAVVDAHLGQHGLARLVKRRPGVRIPGALDGFEVAMQSLIGGRASAGVEGALLAAGRRRRSATRSTPGIPRSPGSRRPRSASSTAGTAGLVALGVDRRAADALVAVARAVVRRHDPARAGP